MIRASLFFPWHFLNFIQGLDQSMFARFSGVNGIKTWPSSSQKTFEVELQMTFGQCSSQIITLTSTWPKSKTQWISSLIGISSYIFLTNPHWWSIMIYIYRKVHLNVVNSGSCCRCPTRSPPKLEHSMPPPTKSHAPSYSCWLHGDLFDVLLWLMITNNMYNYILSC